MLVERLANPVVAPKRRKRRRRPRPASCLRRFRCPTRSLRQRLRPLRPRPALLLAELPRHRPSCCGARRRDHLSALRPRPRKACRTAASILGSPSSQATQRRAIRVNRRPTSSTTATTWLGLRRPSTRRSLTLDRLHRACHPSTAVSCPSGPTPPRLRPAPRTKALLLPLTPPATTGSQTVASAAIPSEPRPLNRHCPRVREEPLSLRAPTSPPAYGSLLPFKSSPLRSLKTSLSDRRSGR